MLNLVQHLIKSMAYEILKRAQGDVLRVLGQPHTSHILESSRETAFAKMQKCLLFSFFMFEVIVLSNVDAVRSTPKKFKMIHTISIN